MPLDRAQPPPWEMPHPRLVQPFAEDLLGDLRLETPGDRGAVPAADPREHLAGQPADEVLLALDVGLRQPPETMPPTWPVGSATATRMP